MIYLLLLLALIDMVAVVHWQCETCGRRWGGQGVVVTVLKAICHMMNGCEMGL